MLANIILSKKFFLIILLFNPFLQQLNFFNQDYCSVKEQDYLYDTIFSKEPLENLFNDMYDNKDLAETMADTYFDLNEFNNNSEQWLIQVKSISTDKEYYFKKEQYFYKTLRMKIYEIQDKESTTSRKTIFDNLQYELYGPNYEYQAKLLHIISEYPNMNLHFFYANNMNYEKYCKSLNEYNKEIGYDDTYDYSLEKINLDTQIVGIKIVYQDDTFENTNDLIWKMKYNNDGILYLGSLTYENEYIYRFELHNFNTFLYENWLLLTLITLGLSLIAILYLYIKYKMK